MQIWPAIDVRGGKCVRLSQGDFHREKVYGNNPADMACRWVAEGATALHVIDLDRAIHGTDVNRDAIARIACEINVDLQVGGGIRDQQAIEDYLSLGIKRIVIGTQAIQDPDWFVRMTETYPDHLLATFDCKNGQAYIDGWKNRSNVSVLEHAKSLSACSIAGMIFTDISKCGMQSGPNVELLASLRSGISIPIIAAGGVTTTDDITTLATLGIEGCVVGKSLYEGRLTLPQALAAAAETHVH